MCARRHSLLLRFSPALAPTNFVRTCGERGTSSFTTTFHSCAHADTFRSHFWRARDAIIYYYVSVLRSRRQVSFCTFGERGTPSFTTTFQSCARADKLRSYFWRARGAIVYYYVSVLRSRRQTSFVLLASAGRHRLHYVSVLRSRRQVSFARLASAGRHRLLLRFSPALAPTNFVRTFDGRGTP